MVCRLAALMCMWTFVAAVAGCGTGTYRSRMDQTLRKLRDPRNRRPSITLDAFFDYLPGMSDGAVTVRIPSVFSSPFNAQSNEPGTNSPIDKRKLWPAGVEIPGFFATYLAQVELVEQHPKGGRIRKEMPYALYLAARPAEGVSELDAARELEQKIVAAINGPGNEKPEETTSTIGTAEVEMVSGEYVEWTTLEIEGQLFFDWTERRTRATTVERLPGKIRLWFLNRDGYQVIVGTKSVPKTDLITHLDEMLELTASTLQIRSAAGADSTDNAG